MDGSKRDDACCKNCSFALEIDGQIICDRDGSSNDCDAVCCHWTRQD